MKPITIRFTTTEANQDILADFVRSQITQFIPTSQDISKIGIVFEIIMDSDYAGNIVVEDSEIGTITSKANKKLFYNFKGRVSSIQVETLGTVGEITLYF